MIEFHSDNDFILEHPRKIQDWITRVVLEEGYELGEIAFVFCGDEYLHDINVRFLNHDTYTDIITFDYSMGKLISGEIYISTERVMENAQEYGVHFKDELHRVIVHGILHLCGFKDKSKEEATEMRRKEDLALQKLSNN